MHTYNWKSFDQWSVTALGTINKNVHDQHKEIRSQLQTRHTLMENHINEVSTKYTNHLGDYTEEVAHMVFQHHKILLDKIGGITTTDTMTDNSGLEEVSMSPTESPVPVYSPLLESSSAWYKEGTFHLDRNTWPDASGSNHAALSGSGLTELRQSGHGATGEVVALGGTTSSKIDFGPVIKAKFTICSVTRYTGWPMGRILQGKEKNWLHGHHMGNTGVAFYAGWKTQDVKNVNPVTDWVVMCGTNAASQLKLVNGVDVGTATGGDGDVTLQVNQGMMAPQTSNFAIAEVVVWDRGLKSTEMYEASEYLMHKFLHPLDPTSITGTELHAFKLPPTLDTQWPKGHSSLWELIYNEVGDYVEEVGTSVLTALGADVVATDRRLTGTSERHFEMEVKWPNGGKHILDEMQDQVQKVEAKVDKLAQQMEEKVEKVEAKVDKLSQHIEEKVDKLSQHIEGMKDVIEKLLQKMG